MQGPYRRLRKYRSEIRLLELDPADELDHPLSGTLRHVELQGANFSALSYVWGDPKNDKSEILIKYEGGVRATFAATLRGGSVPSEHVHEIGSSLARALRHLRQKEHTVIIWVDFLCINQQDEKEKNWQVPLMKSIYVEAKEVHAWLGPRYNENPGTVQSVVSAFKVAQTIWDLSSKIPCSSNIASEMDWLPSCIQVAERNPSDDPRQLVWKDFATALRHAVTSNPTLMSQIESVISLSQNDYFARMWILQETGRARKLIFHFGLKQVSHRPILLALAVINSLRDPKAEPQNQRVYARLNTRFLGCLLARSSCMQKISLRDVLVAAYLNPTSSYQATDPKDLIYARLGLADNPHAIKVDYKLSVAKVFVAASRYLLLEGFLDILTNFRPYLHQRKTFDDKVPSWAYDWSSMSPDVFPGYNASQGTSQQVSISGCAGKRRIQILRMMGTNIGHVAHVNERFSAVVEAAGLHKGTVALASLRAVSEEMTVEKREILIHNIQVTYLQLGATISPEDIDELFKYRSLPFASFWCWWVLWVACLVETIEDAEQLQSDSSVTMNAAELLFRTQARAIERSGDISHIGTKTGLMSLINYQRWSSILGGTSSQGSSGDDFVVQMAELLFRSAWGMRLAVLDSGRFGYVPEDTMPQDKIVIFHGVKTPLVIRQSKANMYRIVGPAHICGVMSGELFAYAPSVEVYKLI